MTIILAAVIFTSCNNETTGDKTVIKSLENSSPVQQQIVTTSVIKNISDSSIINTSKRTIDVLFNGVDNYLGGQRNPKMNFATECMICEPFQVYGQGILFGKRLYVTKDSVIIFQDNREIGDTTGMINIIGHYGERTTKKYKFSQGILTMKYEGQSCNDADFVSVKLSFDKGSISINKLINASFFEYDLDRNGAKEQYLLGTRNCSQELVLIRVNNDNK